MPKLDQKGFINYIPLVLFAGLGVIIYLFITSSAPIREQLFSSLYPKPNSHASGPAKVSMSNGKLYMDGNLFNMKAINYNPISIGSDQVDVAAPISDVPQIAALGANTIATYTSTKIEWQNYTSAGAGDIFYDNLVKAADASNIKLIPGYFSNEAIDWTDASRVSKVTAQYQGLVLKAKDHPSTLIYLIGNETFEKMANDAQKVAYAKWIGDMANWTHTADPNHPVIYADNDQMAAMPYLKSYASSLDIYGYNNYVWSNASELRAILDKVSSNWPGKPYLLHEWGVDSLNVATGKEDQALQSSRIKDLRAILDQVYADPNYLLLGDIIFEYTDDWNKLGSSGTQTPDNGWAWGCKTPFDSKCNEEYWGIASAATAGSADSRTMKSVYSTLKTIWTQSPLPTPTPNASASPVSSPTPPAAVSDITPPSISITSPANYTTVSKNSTLTISANASDNIAVSKIEFYVNASLKCTSANSPAFCVTKLGGKPNSSNIIMAKAYDSSGNTSTTQVIVTVR